MPLLRYTSLLIFVCLLLAGCGSTSDPAENAASDTESAPETATSNADDVGIGTCGLGLGAEQAEEAQIQALLDAEGQFVVAQDIGRLMGLWGNESQIVDAKNTPGSADDDQIWNGKDAIRHRYVRIVFPGAPASVQPADLQISIDGDEAIIRATTQIGSEISPAGDQWLLRNESGCWMIQGLTYNLESK